MVTINLTEEMFASGQPIAQGEVNIWMKKYAPKELLENLAGLKLSEMRIDSNRAIIGHSETGHHHVLEPVLADVPFHEAAQILIDAVNDNLMDIKLLQSCNLIHLRGFDTHKTYTLPPGDYIRSIREEQGPQGWVRVAD